MGMFSGIPVIGSYLDKGVEMAGDLIFDIGKDILSPEQKAGKSNNVAAQIGAKNYTEIKKLKRQGFMDRGARNIKENLPMMPLQKSRDIRSNFKQTSSHYMHKAIENGRGKNTLVAYKQQLTRMKKSDNLYAGMVVDDKKGVV